MELFTVDRRSTLRKGLVCELVEHADITPEDIQKLVAELCPGGVSAHGELYLLRTNSTTNVTDANTEVLFELVRQAKYPHLPSRYQSIFAVDSLDAAQSFKEYTGSNEAPVFQLSADDAFRADMRLLDARMSALVKVMFANRYWQGLPHPEQEPFWEWLVPCPAIIGSRMA